MAVFQLIILLLLAGAVLSAWSRRMNVPYPALLALAGAGLALLPHAPTVNLDPELALALFVAPVLLDAAYDSSPRDLRQNWRPVAGLALSGRATFESGRRLRIGAGTWRAKKNQPPMFHGSSCTQTSGVPSAYGASAAASSGSGIG